MENKGQSAKDIIVGMIHLIFSLIIGGILTLVLKEIGAITGDPHNVIGVWLLTSFLIFLADLAVLFKRTKEWVESL